MLIPMLIMACLERYCKANSDLAHAQIIDALTSANNKQETNKQTKEALFFLMPLLVPWIQKLQDTHLVLSNANCLDC